MNIFEKIKTKKDLKRPINIVLNSTYDYKNHNINVLKSCLNAWSMNDDLNLPYKNTYFDYDWIYVNPEMDEKLYFIRTTKGELMRHKLDDLIDNDNMVASSYMPSDISNIIYSKVMYPAAS